MAPRKKQTSRPSEGSGHHEESSETGSTLYKSSGGGWTYVGHVNERMPPLGGAGGFYSDAGFEVRLSLNMDSRSKVKSTKHYSTQSRLLQ